MSADALALLFAWLPLPKLVFDYSFMHVPDEHQASTCVAICRVL